MDCTLWWYISRLYKKCRNMEFFLVHVFLYLDWIFLYYYSVLFYCYHYRILLRITPYSVRIQENTDQKKLHIWAHFPQGNLQKALNIKNHNIILSKISSTDFSENYGLPQKLLYGPLNTFLIYVKDAVVI